MSFNENSKDLEEKVGSENEGCERKREKDIFYAEFAAGGGIIFWLWYEGLDWRERKWNIWTCKRKKKKI